MPAPSCQDTSLYMNIFPVDDDTLNVDILDGIALFLCFLLHGLILIVLQCSCLLTATSTCFFQDLLLHDR